MISGAVRTISLGRGQMTRSVGMVAVQKRHMFIIAQLFAMRCATSNIQNIESIYPLCLSILG